MRYPLRAVRAAGFFVPVVTGALIISFATSAPQSEASSSSLYYTFNSPGVLQEAGSMRESTSPYFWLNSGGTLTIKDGIGMTAQGELPEGSIWQRLYSLSSALDTGGGTQPQNLFRLLSKSEWENVSQEVAFRVTKTNTVDSPNRDGWSGILLMSRYQDGDNLYYAGIRMDGSAVIKKKQNGTYTTLAQERGVFSGLFDRLGLTPSLIPENTWMRLKSVTKMNADGSIGITLYLDRKNSGSWEKVLSATDSSPLSGGGHVGIRTDYMDVQFDNYRITEI